MNLENLKDPYRMIIGDSKNLRADSSQIIPLVRIIQKRSNPRCVS